MARLQRTDFEVLLQSIRILGEPRTIDAFPAAAMQAVRLLIPGISYSYTEVDLELRRAAGVTDPLDSAPTSDLVAVMNAYLSQHPLITNFAQPKYGGAQMISDFLNTRDYHRLELYADFYRLLDIEHQMVIQLPAPSHRVLGLVANRDLLGFTERDRTLFDLLRPHLIQSYRNAAALTLLDEVAHAGGQQAIWLTTDGRILYATFGAQALFDTYFGLHRAHGTELPECLVEWLEYLRSRDGVEDSRALPPLRVPRPEGSLIVRFLVGPVGGTDLLLLNEQRTTLPARAFAALGLSPRQTEVVRWVVQGKTSAEIGELLGVKSRTVEKHLEHIFVRLDVTSRAGLVTHALQSLGDSSDNRTSVRSSIVLYPAM